jgi:hypothetical protein
MEKGPLRQQQEAIGAQVIGSRPQSYAAFLHDERLKWAQVIRKAGGHRPTAVRWAEEDMAVS